MADTRQKQQERNTSSHAVERSTADEQRPLKRDWDRPSFSPFSVMRRGLDEMERWFGTGMRSEWDQVRRGWMGNAVGDWSPAVEAFHRGNEFVIRADVPGMNRQNLQVEVGEDSVTVHGERKQDRQEEREGVFWTERSYGSFTRVIPLPPGAITDSAKATFNNGVLEVVMQAPSAETRRGRRLDISGADEGKK